MPELPDLEVYVERIAALAGGRRLARIRVASPFLLRTVDPPAEAFAGLPLAGARRLGKRVVLGFGHELFAVVHLMVAGRLHWRSAGAALPRRHGLAAFDFEHGSLLVTEAGSTRRASLHLVRGAPALAGLDPGGLEVLHADAGEFRARLQAESHTLKRALTDPRLFSGIGNAYSDEILHRARLSPAALTRALDGAAIERLHTACREVLTEWTGRLRRAAGAGFPETVTAFREGMAVHGRHRRPCPTCGTAIQRIVYAEHETNYCPHCQTGGRLLADRALSRLLKSDWPRTVAELEEGRVP